MPISDEPPAPGSIEEQVSRVAADRAFFAAVPAWESPARREVERTKQRMRESCIERFGRAPSMNPSQYSEPEIFMALNAMEDAEARFIGAPAAPGATPEDVEVTRVAFGQALLKFANAATRGWPSKQVHEAQERRRLSPTGDGR